MQENDPIGRGKQTIHCADKQTVDFEMTVVVAGVRA